MTSSLHDKVSQGFLDVYLLEAVNTAGSKSLGTGLRAGRCGLCVAHTGSYGCSVFTKQRKVPWYT